MGNNIVGVARVKDVVKKGDDEGFCGKRMYNCGSSTTKMISACWIDGKRQNPKNLDKSRS